MPGVKRYELPGTISPTEIRGQISVKQPTRIAREVMGTPISISGGLSEKKVRLDYSGSQDREYVPATNHAQEKTLEECGIRKSLRQIPASYHA